MNTEQKSCLAWFIAMLGYTAIIIYACSYPSHFTEWCSHHRFWVSLVPLILLAVLVLASTLITIKRKDTK